MENSIVMSEVTPAEIEAYKDGYAKFVRGETAMAHLAGPHLSKFVAEGWNDAYQNKPAKYN